MASFSSLKDSVTSLLGEAGSNLISGSEEIPLSKDKHEKTMIFPECIVVSGNLYTSFQIIENTIFFMVNPQAVCMKMSTLTSAAVFCRWFH